MVEEADEMIFITGGHGKLGKELVRVFPDSLHPSRNELNIADREAVFGFVREKKPDTLIHCAALTGIRQCEDDKNLALKVNVGGTENLVRAFEKYSPDCYFIYISTACVFHGDSGDYVETDIPYPKNFYSLTKLLGEYVIKYSALKKWLIIRTNFVPREKWPYPKSFTDRFGTYLFADDLALAIKSTLDRNLTGILHVCGEEKLSMFELAKIVTPNIQPMTLAEYTGPPVTVNMTLRSARIEPFKITKHPTT
jgi:dTDP-4-dehydrorhamnose reductase